MIIYKNLIKILLKSKKKWHENRGLLKPARKKIFMRNFLKGCDRITLFTFWERIMIVLNNFLRVQRRTVIKVNFLSFYFIKKRAQIAYAQFLEYIRSLLGWIEHNHLLGVLLPSYMAGRGVIEISGRIEICN